jgi:hypothetical protein
MGPRRTRNPVHPGVVASTQTTRVAAGAGTSDAVASGMGSCAQRPVPSCSAGVMDAGASGAQSWLAGAAVTPSVVHAGAGAAVPGLPAVTPSGVVVAVARDQVAVLVDAVGVLLEVRHILTRSDTVWFDLVRALSTELPTRFGCDGTGHRGRREFY